MSMNFMSHAVRSLICMSMSLKAKNILAENQKLIKKLVGLDISKMKKLVVVVALFLGVLVYQILSKLLDYLLKFIYPIHSLNNMDEFWLYDDKDSLSNVSCLFTLEKCKF